MCPPATHLVMQPPAMRLPANRAAWQCACRRLQLLGLPWLRQPLRPLALRRLVSGLPPLHAPVLYWACHCCARWRRPHCCCPCRRCPRCRCPRRRRLRRRCPRRNWAAQRFLPSQQTRPRCGAWRRAHMSRHVVLAPTPYIGMAVGDPLGSVVEFRDPHPPFRRLPAIPLEHNPNAPHQQK